MAGYLNKISAASQVQLKISIVIHIGEAKSFPLNMTSSCHFFVNRSIADKYVAVPSVVIAEATRIG